MRDRPHLRLIGVLAFGALWLNLVAPAAQAATGKTRWVDDDARGNGGPKACARAHFTSIQAAIDVSAPGDRVFVCPGTYTEQLVVDKPIVVRAQPQGGAVIQAPADLAPGSNDLVTLSGDNVHFRGFKIRIAAGDPGGPACSQVQLAIVVLGQNDVVRNNNIAATGQATLTGSCGYEGGIDVGGPSTSALVKLNHVTDFRSAGILVQSSSARVLSNVVRFMHANEAACRSFVDCNYFGLFVEAGDVAGNTLYSGPAACVTSSCATGATPAMIGIYASSDAGASAITIDSNTVSRTLAGLMLYFASPQTLIAGNTFTDGNTGMLLESSTGGEATGNVAGGNLMGVFVDGAAGMNIHDNDFRGNSALDCQDMTTGSGTAGTANTWTNDLGDSSLPDGLCAPPTQ